METSTCSFSCPLLRMCGFWFSTDLKAQVGTTARMLTRLHRLVLAPVDLELNRPKSRGVLCQAETTSDRSIHLHLCLRRTGPAACLLHFWANWCSFFGPWTSRPWFQQLKITDILFAYRTNQKRGDVSTGIVTPDRADRVILKMHAYTPTFSLYMHAHATCTLVYACMYVHVSLLRLSQIRFLTQASVPLKEDAVSWSPCMSAIVRSSSCRPILGCVCYLDSRSCTCNPSCKALK